MGDKDGDLQAVENFPMDTVIPMAALYYLTHFSEIFEVDDKFVTLGYSLITSKCSPKSKTKCLRQSSKISITQPTKMMTMLFSRFLLMTICSTPSLQFLPQ